MSREKGLLAVKEKYRPEIDGLRAFAVVAVIVNHFNKNILPGGYLGVDIFFVISGYVITSSLSGRSSINFKDFISGFYERRIKRLVPALSFFVLIASIIFCLFNASPGVSLKTGLTSLFGISNLYLFMQSTDYFAQSTQLNIFSHTWSLGVEEQFYFLFPFLIWFTGFGRQTKNGSRNLFLVVLFLSIISLVGFIYIYSVNLPAAYFLMPTRFWEMASGCLIFIACQQKLSIQKSLNNVPSLIVLALIVLIMFLPSSFAVVSTCSVVVLSSVLIATLKKDTPIFNVLTNSNIVYLGLISYSLYLWHWGVLSISRWTIGIHLWSAPFQVFLIFGLSIASYKWIETPLRKGKWFKEQWKTFLILGGIVLSSSGGLIFLGKSRLIGSISKYLGIIEIDNKTIALNQNIPGTTINRKNCHDDSIGNYKEFSKVIQNCAHNFAPSSKENFSIYLGGDSHSYVLRPAFSKISSDLGAKLYSISGPRFPPNRIRYKNGKLLGNPKLIDDYMKFISSEAVKGDVVVISNRLSWMFSEGNSINKDDLRNFNLVYKNKEGRKLSNQEAMDIWALELLEYSKILISKGVNIVYVLPFPEFTKSAPHCLANVMMPKDCSEVDKQYLLDRYSDIYSTMRSIESRLTGFYLVDPFDVLCSSSKCKMIANDGRSIMYIDSNHLSNFGSNLLIPILKEVIK